MNDKLRVFTSFTGIGSPEMSLKELGVDFELIGMSEVDRYALLAYDAIHNDRQNEVIKKTKEEMLYEMKTKNIGYNFSTNKNEIPKKEIEIKKLYDAHIRNKNYGDIRIIDEKSLPDFDLFTYSFPCKNISIAGKQAGLNKDSNTQSSLLWECERIIIEKTPKFLLMENVKNLIGNNHMSNFQEWIDLLSEIGYNSYWKVLNAKDFGTPQNRERVMMWSVLKEFDKGVEMPIENNDPFSSIVNIIDLDFDSKYIVNKEFKLSSLFYDKEIRDGKIIEIAHTNCSYSQNARCYGINGISPTLSARDWKDAKKILVPNTRGIKNICSKESFILRKMTPLEYWRVMGFSDLDFNKAKDIGGLSNTKLYERAGRGIVIPMLNEIFKVFLKDYIK